jgi:RNA polymerase sigma-70 factor (ECF subfamily)
MNEISELVLLARSGDRTAFGRLCEQFRPMVYAVGMARLRNPTEAEELVQEVFLHVLSKLSQLREVDCFAGWLRKIAVRMAINKLTRRGPFQGVEPEVLDQNEARAGTPLENMVRDEKCGAVREALERLRPIDRTALVAFYLQGHTLKQMSRDFETPVGTIKRRLHVARNRLRKFLERRLGKRTRSNPPRETACV